jgi:hypothetical protein
MNPVELAATIKIYLLGMGVLIALAAVKELFFSPRVRRIYTSASTESPRARRAAEPPPPPPEPEPEPEPQPEPESALVPQEPAPLDAAGYDELKRLYRRMMKQWHPDLGQDTAERPVRERISAQINELHEKQDLERLRMLERFVRRLRPGAAE